MHITRAKQKSLTLIVFRITLDLKSQIAFEDKYHHHSQPQKKINTTAGFSRIYSKKLPPPPTALNITENFNIKIFWSGFCLSGFLSMVGSEIDFTFFFSEASVFLSCG